MTCRELNDFLADYVDGDLPRDLRRAFEDHLAKCPDCVRFVESYRATIRLERHAMARDPEVALPPSLVNAILRATRPGK